MTTQIISKRDAWITAWSKPKTREVSIGEGLVACMLVTMEPKIGSTFVDFGCGTGRAARRLSNLSYPCIGLDWAPNCLDDDLQWNAEAETGVPLVVADLTRLPAVRYADYGYCCDVLSPDTPVSALEGIARTTRLGAFLAIDCSLPPRHGLWERATARYWSAVTFAMLGNIALLACREPLHGADRIS